MPLIALKMLKSHRVAIIREKLEKMINLELKMHEITMGTPEVIENIKRMFTGINDQ